MQGKRKKELKQSLTAASFLAPSLLGLILFSAVPVVFSMFISLTDWNGLDQLTAPGFFQEHFIGLDNYKAILSSSEFWGVLWNTFRYIIMYIPLMLVASLGVAYLLSRQRRGVTAFRIIYYIPVLTSWVAASMIWKSMLSPEYGAVNNILAIFGIQGPGWLLDEAWAMPAIVLVSVWKDMGFFGLILLSGMVGINKAEDLEELRSEKALLVQKFEYAEDAGAEAFRKDIAIMEAGLKKLEAQEQKYSAELDKALDEYAELKAQAADFDSVELYKARQVLRPAQEKAAERQLEETLQKKPSFSLLLSAKQEVSRLLGEDTEERQARQMVIRRQRSDPQKPKHFQR